MAENVIFKIEWYTDLYNRRPRVTRYINGKRRRLQHTATIRYYIDNGLLTDPEVVRYFGGG